MNLYEGVNTLLASIGEIPITDNTAANEAEATSDVGIARDTLLQMSRSIQAQGYWFNKEFDYPLVPSTEDVIAIGEAVIGINHDTYIIKDHKLYDTETRSYIFTTTQEVDITFDIAFDDLPFEATDAIVREAVVEYYNNMLGDSQELRILQTNAQRAQVALQKAQSRHRRVNLMKGSRLLDRRTNPTGIQ